MAAIQTTEAKVWDARAEFALGVFMRRYLRDDPPPPGSLLQPDVQRWSDGLLSDGRSRLQALGARHLAAVGRDVEEARRPERRDRSELEEERLRAERAWRDLSAAARESLLLQALGDDRLLLRELTLRMNAALGYGDVRAVYDVHVRYLAAKMIRQGQLERSHERFNGAKIRNRYHRPGAITAPEGGE